MGLTAVVNGLDKGGAYDRQTTQELSGRLMKGELSCGVAARKAMDEILCKASRFAKARRSFGLTGAHAATAKLVKRPVDGLGYTKVKDRKVTQVPMIASRILEPKEAPGVKMLECLPNEDAGYYAHEQFVVDPVGKSQIIFKELETQFAFVGGSESEYISYWHRDDIGYLWNWDTLDGVKAFAGFSTVVKKNGWDLRKLLMACPANYMFSDPKPRGALGMCAGSSLARSFSTDGLAGAALDEDSAFTFVETPPWMWKWVAAPPIKASKVWDVLPLSLRARITPQTFVAACYKRLAMGMSHSVLILMKINLHCIGKALFNYNRQLSNPSAIALDVSPTMILDSHFKGVEHDPDLCDELLACHDDQWMTRQEWRRLPSSSHSQYTVAEWCTTVRFAKQSDQRVFVGMHYFGGDHRPGDLQDWLEKFVVEAGLILLFLTVDITHDPQWDLTLPNTYDSICALALEGLLDVFVAGPPCNTVSRLRHLFLENGPRPLRSRVLPWGLPGLSANENSRLIEANRLWLNTMSLAEIVSMQGGGHLIEHPGDPGEPYPSLWCTTEMTEMEARTNAVRSHMHQCPFGGIAPKYTIWSGAIDEMPSLDQVWCPGISDSHVHGISHGRKSDGTFYSRALQRYPNKLCRHIAWMISRTIVRFATCYVGPTGCLRTFVPEAHQRVTSWGSRADSSTRGGIAFLNEDTHTGKSVVLGGDQSAVYFHVDDGIVLSGVAPGPYHANTIVNVMVEALTDIGFSISQLVLHPHLDKAVGYTTLFDEAKLQLPAERGVRLRMALLNLTNYKVVDVAILHSLVGVWIYGSLLCRELLSIPFHVSAFLEKYEDQLVSWSHSVKIEVVAMANAIPFVEVHIGCKLPSVIFATDACGSDDNFNGGYGIVASGINRDEVVDILNKGQSPGKQMATANMLGGAKNPYAPLVPTAPFTKLSEELVVQDRWETVSVGEFNFPEHITLLEARVVVRLLRLISMYPQLHDSLIISLQDNAATAAALSKGRSSVCQFNRMLRMRASVCLACRIRLFAPWVQSKLMPADFLSRFLKNGGAI